jgi:radical SAM superfamily enzyme YgiQ (UPF0313 family)
MKVSLVFPPFYMDSMYNLPPLGLINLATLLGNDGHEAVIHDLVLAIRTKDLGIDKTIYDQSAEMILAAQPDLVAFSAQCTTYPTVVQIAQKIKTAAPNVKIIIGGHNASFVDVITLERFDQFDAVVRGEGELTFGELITAYQTDGTAGAVAGVTCRIGSEIKTNPDRPLIPDLDVLPLPDYSFVPPLSVYRDACDLPRSIAVLEVGRGCPHRCIYCSESVLWRRRTRTFSVSRLVTEIGHLSKNHGAECFLLAYDQFTAKRNFVQDFCNAVISAGLNHLPWYCISRLDTVDKEVLGLMRAAGCESMCYGIDSGSAKTLAFIGKQIDQKILYKRVRETTDEGMVPTLSFVIGFPEETIQDIDATLTLALKTGIQGNSNPLIQMPTVLPGTGLYARYLKNLVRRVDTYFALGLEFDQGHRLADDDQLIDEHPDIFSSFYNLATSGPALEALHLTAGFFPLIVNYYPKSFLLISMALKRSVSELFLAFLEYVQKTENRQEPGLSPADCYQHFGVFANDLLETTADTAWNHLPQVIMYEEKAVAVAKPGRLPPVANVDISGADNWAPKKKENLIVAQFTKNMPRIISDLKEGIFEEHYPDEPTWLVFYQEANALEVTEINDFGKDFLALCNGVKNVEAIAAALFKKYGNDMTREDFSKACLEAAQGLTGMNFLSAD